MVQKEKPLFHSTRGTAISYLLSLIVLFFLVIDLTSVKAVYRRLSPLSSLSHDVFNGEDALGVVAEGSRGGGYGDLSDVVHGHGGGQHGLHTR